MEALVRVLDLASELQYQPNPFYGWSLTPYSSSSRNQSGIRIKVEINSQGLRDYEYPYRKQRGSLRLLVLGDSFAEALQVPLEVSFPKLVERFLNARKIGGYEKVEVINAGTSGYGTDNELLFFEHTGHKYAPDIVLLAFCVCNDVRNNWYELENIDSGGFRKPYFILDSYQLELKNYPFIRQNDPLSRVRVFLNNHVRLYTFLRQARDMWRNKKTVEKVGMPLDWAIFSLSYSQPWENAWEITKALLLRLDEKVSEHGAKLFVVIIPTHFQVDPQYWKEALDTYPEVRSQEWDLGRPNRILRDFFEEHRVRFIDLLPYFQEYSLKFNKDLYIPFDEHFNAEGHRLAAEIISEELIKQRVMERR